MGEAEPNEQLPSRDRDKADPHRNGDGPERAATDPATSAEDSTEAAGVKAKERRTLRVLRRQFAELREHSAAYLAARVDGARASARRTTIWLALGTLGFLSVGGLIIVASCFVLSGIARGLEPLFGAQAWIGTLLTGAATLAAVAVGVRWGFVAVRENARRGTVDKYEARQANQRRRFGRDAHDRTQPPADSGE